MFNIITPTFNRAHLLERVMMSLKAQSDNNFIWIIVDDGSTDSTEQLVRQWQHELLELKINYYKLARNSGKPAAVNFGVQKSKYAYTIIADSDDSFEPNTLEKLRYYWSKIEQEDLNNIGAIWTLVKNEDGNIQGDRFPENPWIVDFKERVLMQKNSLKGDKWHCWRTDVLREFPLIEDSKCHVGESHTWNAINKKYLFYCVNDAFLTAYFSEISLMNSSRPRAIRARAEYLSGYHGLKQVSVGNIVRYRYYRMLAFSYIKGMLFGSRPEVKLTFIKEFISVIIFLSQLPFKLINR